MSQAHAPTVSWTWKRLHLQLSLNIFADQSTICDREPDSAVQHQWQADKQHLCLFWSHSQWKRWCLLGCWSRKSHLSKILIRFKRNEVPQHYTGNQKDWYLKSRSDSQISCSYRKITIQKLWAISLEFLTSTIIPINSDLKVNNRSSMKLLTVCFAFFSTREILKSIKSIKIESALGTSFFSLPYWFLAVYYLPHDRPKKAGTC